VERDHNASGRCEQVDGDVVNVRSGEQLRELCTFVDNSVAPDGGSSEETQEKLEEKLLSLS